MILYYDIGSSLLYRILKEPSISTVCAVSVSIGGIGIVSPITANCHNALQNTDVKY